MPPPPELTDDAITEILLRLPPDEPENLMRASLVCKPWLRILTDPGFRRRYSAFHRTPPVLGLLHACQVIGGGPPPSFNPTTAAPFTPYPYYRRPLDCHHGRVLLHANDDGWYLVVWDPVTGDRQRVPEAGINWLIYSAAVFCAVSGCDHIDCHGGPFRVVFITIEDYTDAVKATVYSSETDEMYFTLRWKNAIVKYNWSKNCISLIDPPSHTAYFVTLMEMGDNALGFACIEGSSLHLWSRKVGTEGTAEWMQCRVIELDGRIPGVKSKGGGHVVGSAEGADVIFVATDVGLVTFKLKSGRVTKVDDAQAYFSVLPYMSFYTPGTEGLLIRVKCSVGCMIMTKCWFRIVKTYKGYKADKFRNLGDTTGNEETSIGRYN
ncbi:hypothetical protein HU200_035309 [Digitaria exilis]|uniref:F-box domain-containing protein n=1 Tax=Digitaria exilis TaxID=1010633 RepID=A0A835BHV2_9POAL|nr:hypothetical protein HU200_035309 [Digitaria exilis]